MIDFAVGGEAVAKLQLSRSVLRASREPSYIGRIALLSVVLWLVMATFMVEMKQEGLELRWVFGLSACKPRSRQKQSG